MFHFSGIFILFHAYLRISPPLYPDTGKMRKRINKPEKICRITIVDYLCNPETKTGVLQSNGSIAQLVQSVCLTSRGSGVRLPLLPPPEREAKS